MLKEVKLLGKLGLKFGRMWYLAINSPEQAIRAIAANCSDFISYLYQSEEKGIFYRVVIDNNCEGVDETQLDYPVGKKLIIAPIVHGAGGFGRILLGAALIGASAFMPASIGLLGFGISSATVGLIGASLVLGGITQMISPIPGTGNRTDRTSSDAAKSDSFLFDRASELGDQGLCVPVLYGERIIADPIVISSGIITQEIPIV